ncbi:hypothetical protein [Dyadobacter luticola]|uniref:Outer membrane protein beta-barrel domain-containing protein n=1 Tax=Dyadobacter luticola TaxID=1979387 RepID=A0A5R9KRF8_9BACT|nr:hypothetical protein [Dyadobacter luticola]TLU98813.1 hypothetical protein FEN17_19635 [Dyadobacter luticola]
MQLNSTKKALLLLSFLAFSIQSQAQNTRSFFSVAGGYSLPVGELAREKLDDPFAGLTGSGYFGQANYDFRVFRWLGLRASGSMNINNTNSAPILEKADTYAELLNDTYNWQSRVSRWKLNAVMLGPALYINFKRVQIELHAQAGKIWANSPSVNLVGTSKSGGETLNVNLIPASTSAFGLAGGLSLRLPLAGALFFQIGADMIGAEAEIKDVSVEVTRGTYKYNDRIHEKRFVGVVNAGAGFGLAF